MSLQEEISAALKHAMRTRDEAQLSSLRLLLTAIKRREKEFCRSLDDQEVIAVISSQIKQRHESIEKYREAGREDLAQSEQDELKVLQGFMPEQLSEKQVEIALDEIIAELGAASMKDMGIVMRLAMARLGGRAEGRTINTIVKAKLGG